MASTVSRENLFIVADDLGLAESVNDGIFFALENKLINSASLMANGAAFDHAVKKIKCNPNFKFGLHLVLVEEESLLNKDYISSLINNKGTLHENHKIFFIRYLLGLIEKDEIEKEIRAQVNKCLNSGIKLAFINSHQHLHLLPGILDIVIDIAKENRIPYIRIPNEPINLEKGRLFRNAQLIFLKLLSRLAKRKIVKNNLLCNDLFVGFINAGALNKKVMARGVDLSNKHFDKNIELGCHPGFETEELIDKYKHWGYNWEKEIKTLNENNLSKSV